MQSSNRCLWRPSVRAVLILYLSFTACTTWRPEAVTPQAVVQRQPQTLRITRNDSSSVVVNHPQLHGDTIVGPDPHMTQVRVPLDSVLLTETRHGDGGKTGLVLLGVAAALFLVSYVALPRSY